MGAVGWDHPKKPMVRTVGAFLPPKVPILSIPRWLPYFFLSSFSSLDTQVGTNSVDIVEELLSLASSLRKEGLPFE